MILSYECVSSEDQHLDGSVAPPEADDARRIFARKISGSKSGRPELDQLRDGEVVIVMRYGRLSRSLQDLLTIVARIRERGATFRSLVEDIDTTTLTGRLPRLCDHRPVRAGTDRGENEERLACGAHVRPFRRASPRLVGRAPCRGSAHAGRGGPQHRRAGADLPGFAQHDQAALMADDWSAAENDVVVANYLDMLRGEQAGRAYPEAEHERGVERAAGRGRGPTGS